MATSHANHHLATVLLVFLLLTTTSSSLARPFNNYYLGLAATEPTLNLALPSDRVAPPEEDQSPRHVSPYGHLRVAGKKLGGAKYGPLVLNMLPKGPVPPSGPSKGTNDFNN